MSKIIKVKLINESSYKRENFPNSYQEFISWINDNFMKGKDNKPKSLKFYLCLIGVLAGVYLALVGILTIRNIQFSVPDHQPYYKS